MPAYYRKKHQLNSLPETSTTDVDGLQKLLLAGVKN